MASMEGVWAKFGRAKAHEKDYIVACARFLYDKPYTVALDFDAETGWHAFRWQVNGDPPGDDFSLIFGDMLTNLRGSLDYLIWQLILQAGNTPDRWNAFPVAKNSKEWATAERRNFLRGVDPYWASHVKSLQPCHGPQPELHPLAILDHVNNINKHRFLPPVVVSGTQIRFKVSELSDRAGERVTMENLMDEGPIEDGAIAMRFRIESGSRLNVNVEDEMAFRIAFRDGLDIGWKTDDVFEWVERTLTSFEPAFSS